MIQIFILSDLSLIVYVSPQKRKNRPARRFYSEKFLSFATA